MRRRIAAIPLFGIVLTHLLISIVHGQAHTAAHVALSTPMAAFVYVVILAGPLAGVAVWPWRPAAGAWIATACFGGSLVFGLVNHFIIAGADRVDHVAAEWRTLFGITAALLLASEAAGFVVGVSCAMHTPRRAS